MDYKKPSRRPEDIIQDALIIYLQAKGWHVMRTHGNMYQMGFPDLRISHPKYGPRWVEVKLPGMKGSVFTQAQWQNFPKMQSNMDPIWVLTAATDSEYAKLFKPSNLYLALQGIL